MHSGSPDSSPGSRSLLIVAFLSAEYEVRFEGLKTFCTGTLQKPVIPKQLIFFPSISIPCKGVVIS